MLTFEPSPEEGFRAKLASGNSIIPGTHDLLFDDYCLAAERADTGMIVDLVVRANNFGFVGVAANDWVAAHPSAMKTIGLVLDRGFSPCWRTETGSLGCVSIGWQDGTWMHRHYHGYAPAGSGWYVLLRADLWDQLKARIDKQPTAVTGMRRELQKPEGSEWVTIWKDCWIYV